MQEVPIFKHKEIFPYPRTGSVVRTTVWGGVVNSVHLVNESVNIAVLIVDIWCYPKTGGCGFC